MSPAEPRYSVVIPCYNEAATLPQLLPRCLAVLDALPGPAELICVDDGSSDSTPHLLREAAAREPRLKVVLLARNFGQYSAIRHGFGRARGEFIFTLDADLQNPPEELPRLLDALTPDYDSVAGRRQQRQDPLWRHLPSIAVSALTSRLTGVRLHDYGCMLRVYRRPVIDRILACPERVTYLNALLTWLAPRTREITVRHEPRRQGQSHYPLRPLIACALNIVTGFAAPPFFLAILFGLLLVVAGAAALLVLPFVAAPPLAWLAAAAAIVGGGLLAMQGLCGEYLLRIYREVQQRPLVQARETINC